MSTHPARIFASVLLLGGGFVVGVTALAIGLARLLVDAGATVRPADAALLADLVPVLPFIVAFCAPQPRRRRRARGRAERGPTRWRSASRSSRVVTGVTGLLLIVAGSDPFASSVSGHATANGIGIVGAFTVAYVAVLVAIADARQPHRLAQGAVA